MLRERPAFSGTRTLPGCTAWKSMMAPDHELRLFMVTYIHTLGYIQVNYIGSLALAKRKRPDRPFLQLPDRLLGPTDRPNFLIQTDRDRFRTFKKKLKTHLPTFMLTRPTRPSFRPLFIFELDRTDRTDATDTCSDRTDRFFRPSTLRGRP